VLRFSHISGFHHSVAVSPFPLAVAVSVHRCRCCCRCRCAYLFAVYGCNEMEFSYVIFTEQRNFTTAERRNGSGRTATEWWKQGISHLRFRMSDVRYRLTRRSDVTFHAINTNQSDLFTQVPETELSLFPVVFICLSRDVLPVFACGSWPSECGPQINIEPAASWVNSIYWCP